MPRYRPGDHVFLHLDRCERLRLEFRTGTGALSFKVIRVLPAGEDGVASYAVQCSSEPHARVAKEHDLAPPLKAPVNDPFSQDLMR